MLDDLKIFVCATERQSLTDAAAKLGMTVATVSRRLRDLEKQLGCELFHRSNKGLVLTPAGKLYYQECAGYINDLELRLENLHNSLNSVNGKLRVTAPTNIGSGPLDEFWQIFVSKYPEISLTVQLSDPTDDAIPQHADIAIASGPQKNSSLIQKLLGSVTPILVASSKRTDNPPESISDLKNYPSIAAELFSSWELISNDKKESVHKTHNHISNDMAVTLTLVRAGAGIALLPKSMVYCGLDNGDLVQVMPEWSGIARQIYLVWPYQRTLSIRAKTFRDELTDFLQKQTWFDPA